MARDSRLNDIVQSEFTSIGIHSAVDGSIVVPKLRAIIDEPSPAEFDRVRYVERMVDVGDEVHRVRIQKGYKGASVQDYHLEHKPESFL